MSSCSSDDAFYSSRRYGRSPSPSYDNGRSSHNRHSGNKKSKKKDHHGSHRSSSSKAYEHEHRRHDSHDRKDRDTHHRRDEFRHESAPSRVYSRMSSYSPPRNRISYSSPERTTLTRPKKEGDVIENMNNSFTDGPLEALKRCVHDRIKVMVWIRNHRGIRGICTGFVLAFDKFWNLVMQDVDEVYQKTQHPKTPFLQSVEPLCNLPEAKLGKKKKKSMAKKDKVVKKVEMSESARQEARERKKKRKDEEKKRRAQERAVVCKRNVKKLFVRGDNVVLIKVVE